MPINKTGKKKDGRMQYCVRVSCIDDAGKAHRIERTAYGNAEAVALEQHIFTTLRGCGDLIENNKIRPEGRRSGITNNRRYRHEKEERAPRRWRLQLSIYLGLYH